MPLSSHPKRHFKGGCGKVATTNDVRTEPPVRTLAGRGSGSAFHMSERLTWACCGLVGLHPKTYRFASKRTGDEGLRARLRELASQRWRFGYRRLGLMLERQGIKLSPKNLPALPGRTAVRAQAGGGPQAGARHPGADGHPAGPQPALVARLRLGQAPGGRRFGILTVPWSTTSPGTASAWRSTPRSPPHGSCASSIALSRPGAAPA
jgi:hypothetical protein